MAKKTSTKAEPKKEQVKEVVKAAPKYKPADGEICTFTSGNESFLGSVENGEVMETYVNGGCQVTRPRGLASDYIASKASKDDLRSLRRM